MKIKTTKDGHFKVKELGGLDLCVIWCIVPVTSQAKEWLEEHSESGEWNVSDGSLTVQAEMGTALLCDARDDLA